jgi:hypothetical protein
MPAFLCQILKKSNYIGPRSRSVDEGDNNGDVGDGASSSSSSSSSSSESCDESATTTTTSTATSAAATTAAAATTTTTAKRRRRKPVDGKSGERQQRRPKKKKSSQLRRNIRELMAEDNLMETTKEARVSQCLPGEPLWFSGKVAKNEKKKN